MSVRQSANWVETGRARDGSPVRIAPCPTCGRAVTTVVVGRLLRTEPLPFGPGGTFTITNHRVHLVALPCDHEFDSVTASGFCCPGADSVIAVLFVN